MEKLFVFNGSGTILDTRLSGFRLLASAIGKKEEMLEHLKYYQEVKKQGPWGLEELAMMFKGVKQKELQERAEYIVKNNLMKGTKKLIKKLKNNGFYITFYSSDLLEIALGLKKQLKLDEILGNELKYKKGIATGRLKRKVNRYIRAERIKQIVEGNNLKKENVYILGNSITALPSKPYGKFMGFNLKDKQLREEADVVVKGKDLTNVLKVIN